MEIDIDFGNPVMNIDILIRRTLQDHFSELQPPITIWGSIQRRLTNRKLRKLERLMHKLQPHTTTTQRSDQG